MSQWPLEGLLLVGLGWAGLSRSGSGWVNRSRPERAAPDTWDKPEGEGGSLSLKGLVGHAAHRQSDSKTTREKEPQGHCYPRTPSPTRRLLYAPRRSTVKNSEPLSSAKCPARCQLHIERCCECEDQLYREYYVPLAGWSCVVAWQLACYYAKLRVCLRSPATLHVYSWLCRC